MEKESKELKAALTGERVEPVKVATKKAEPIKKMEFSAKQIASFIGGKVEGDENATVNSFAKIEE